MRGKRSKAYRKLLKQFELAFNFRQPYQVLVDADIVRDARRFAIDLPQYLSNTLHGEVKILITQCSMRHLYAQNREPGMDRVIETAKTFERRRCGHHPETHPEPCSALECLGSVVGPTNKHRYVVASQDGDVRARFRSIAGVPLVYISRSVMIVSTWTGAPLISLPKSRRLLLVVDPEGNVVRMQLEPMASATARVVQKGERAKFRAELREPAAPAGSKRKRDDDSDASGDEDGKKAAEAEKKKKKRKGLKGPNPLSVKKPKKAQQQQPPRSKPEDSGREGGGPDEPSSEQPAKKKRKRKQKKAEGGEGGEEAQQALSIDADE